jgi:hypothetical protein
MAFSNYIKNRLYSFGMNLNAACALAPNVNAGAIIPH